MKKSAKEHQRNENRKKIARARHFLRVTYPAFCIFFVVSFWLLGLYHYWSNGGEVRQGEVS